MKNKIPVAVIAATGAVGQRFINLLDGHPWFKVVALTGSERREGQKYGESVHWILSDPMPDWAADMQIKPSRPKALDVPLVFSALPRQYATEIEATFARAGVAVCSNAGAYRTDPLVPILVPEINSHQLELIALQRQAKGWDGLIATNSNCTSTGLTISLKILDDAFGVKRVFATSLQAISGAG